MSLLGLGLGLGSFGFTGDFNVLILDTYYHFFHICFQ